MSDQTGRVTFSLDKNIQLFDLDKKVLAKGFRKVGKTVSSMAKKNVSRRAYISKAGEFPGMHTGVLRRMIRHSVSSSGHSVVVKSYPNDNEPPYPFYVLYGHRAPKADRLKGGAFDPRQHGKIRSGKKVAAPRNNWIVAAAEAYESTYVNTVAPHLVSEAMKLTRVDK